MAGDVEAVLGAPDSSTGSEAVFWCEPTAGLVLGTDWD